VNRIPPHLKNIRELDVSNTDVTDIPILPRLFILNCSSTKITKLPQLDNLRILTCNNTLITTLPVLPTITRIECRNTPLSEIQKYGTLRSLELDNTQLKSIPYQPILRTLELSNCDFLITNENKNEITKVHNCKWLNPSNDQIISVCKIQRCIRRRLYKIRFNSRLFLIKRLPLDIVNIISSY
jgi:hypothetical protein